MDEPDPRPYRAISIDLASAETSTERFTRDDIYTPPPTAPWRCNLTALSQRYNLYFVASLSGVAVYVPQFPFQRLGSRAKLFIPPTLARPSARGYIDDRTDPHSINHLMVGDLGDEEILLLSTDSGNVTAYHTRRIDEAIKKDPYKFSENARSDLVGLRAFFSQWVSESAWGLSIHTEGRMIAVSANVPHDFPSLADNPTATILVFAFALVQNEADNDRSVVDVDAGLDESEWREWDVSGPKTDTPLRDRNYKIVLRGETGHRFNVPSISFVNTSQDVSGTWLLSTDIQGSMKLWQIWQGVCARTWNFASDNDEHVNLHTHDDGGWVVTALEPAAFRPAYTMLQFCGHYSAPKYPTNSSESYDLSHIVQLTVPGRSHRHPLVRTVSDDEEINEDDHEHAAVYWSGDDSDTASTYGASSNPAASSSVPAAEEATTNGISTLSITDGNTLNAVVTQTIEQDIEDVLLDRYVSDFEDSDDEFEVDSDVEGDGLDGTPFEGPRDSSEDSFASQTSFSGVSRQESAQAEAGVAAFRSPRTQVSPVDSLDGRHVRKRRRSMVQHRHEGLDGLSFPVLHCSTANVRLLDVPRERNPHIFCADLLHQQLPTFWRGPPRALRRLNMVQSIPEIGVVIIANQLGRCAVCALTRNRQTGTTGLRVDWVLPTKRQERAGQRPNFWLLGIATAPIQGLWTENNSSSSEEELWGQDATQSGFEVSFDPGVLVLPDARKGEQHSDSEDDESTARAAKRNRRSSQVSNSSSAASTQHRVWHKPQMTHTEKRVMESSQRYRLMMTYADMTVLTYEMSRDS